MEVSTGDERIKITCTDEDRNRVEIQSEKTFEVANNPQQQERLKQQLMKCGDSDFVCEDIHFADGKVLFVPAAAANALRREVLEELTRQRGKQREKLLPGTENKDLLYPGAGDWHLNIVNRKAALFYAEHGKKEVEPGFEKSARQQERDLMRTRYCLLHELGRCRKVHPNEDLRFPLYLCNDKHQFLLEFDCKACFMKVLKNC